MEVCCDHHALRGVRKELVRRVLQVRARESDGELALVLLRLLQMLPVCSGRQQHHGYVCVGPQQQTQDIPRQWLLESCSHC